MMEITTGPTVSPALGKINPIPNLIRQARLLRKNRESSLALALLRRACGLESDNFEVLTLMSEILVDADKREEALKVRKVIKELYPEFLTFYHFAEELYLSGQNDEEALKAYFECLSVMEDGVPQLFDIYKNMGNISVKLGDFDGAEEFYNKAYTLKSTSDTLLINFGTLEIQRGDFDRALFCFREAIKINPKNDKAWVGLALMHSEYGDYPLAWANLISALDLQPFNRTAVLLCVKWGLRDHREALAIEAAEKFLSHESFDEEISLFLIHLYCYLNQFDKAQLETTKILAWNPELQAAREIEKQLRCMGEVA
jgi:tetratricopeptide (TPR) repeat protein